MLLKGRKAKWKQFLDLGSAVKGKTNFPTVVQILLSQYNRTFPFYLSNPAGKHLTCCIFRKIPQ